MSAAHFRVTYDGTALASGEMDVRELAPALLAISALLKSANKALQGERAEVRVNVRGSFKTGSFGIDLAVMQDFVQNVKDIFAGDSATAVANALAIVGAVGFFGKGLIELLRKLRGRLPEKIETVDNTVVIYVEKEIITVEREVYLLFVDRDTRQGLEDTLKPLEEPGIDRVAFGTDSEIAEVISKEDKQWFTVPEQVEKALFEDTSRIMLSIESAVFKEGNKWRLSDGTTSFHAEILDLEFVAKIEAGERFGKGDQLIVDLRRSQYQIDGKLRTDFAVMNVVEHLLPPQSRLL